MAVHSLFPRQPRRPRRRPTVGSRSRRLRGGFGWRLLFVAAGGFAGTLTVLQSGIDLPAAAAGIGLESRAASDTLSARFALCHSGGGRNCVVDGDTFWFEGQKYRIADIDTPETHPARCAREAALGEAATEQLRDWLNKGAFRLERRGSDIDRYGRKLRVVTRDGASVGDALVDAGLARRWDGQRRPWCF